jgi:hypothetical protein
MMRILPVAALVLAAGCLHAAPASAREGPWCALISLGTGAVYEDCQYYSRRRAGLSSWPAIADSATRIRGGSGRRPGRPSVTSDGFITTDRRQSAPVAFRVRFWL